MVHDKLPYALQSHISHSLRELERAADRINDQLDTIQQLSRPLTVGLDNEFRGLDTLIQELKTRWAYYLANGAWADSVTAKRIRAPRATAQPTQSTQLEPVENGDSERPANGSEV
jgi:hypothetical protein